MKVCCKCKESKDISEFYRQKSRKDGLSPECKACEKQRKLEYYNNNLEHVRKNKRENAEKNKEKRHEYQKRKYHENIEESRQRGRDKYNRFRDKIREKENARQKTPEGRKKAAERAKRWREESKELYNAYLKVFRSKNKLKISAVQKVGDALRYGKMVKPEICEKCGKKTELQGHHEEYTKPLDVKWLCRLCHCHEHNKLMDIP